MLALDAVTLAPESLPERTDLREIFGNDHAIELEIGCGKGGFLLRRAKEHPELNFLGIEWANEFFKHSADRMARWGMTNVRIMRTDAKHFVIHRLAEQSLAALHIYHPDPWPKKRHHKRRLISTDFIDAASKVLRMGARLAIQTDHAEYFEQIQSVTAACSRIAPVEFDDPAYGTIAENTQTNFEIKYVKEGRPIYRLAFKRTA